MPPVVCVVGHSNSGKTTVVEGVLRELTSRGYRIASVKHAREIDIDRPGTDSWRHLKAGSQVIVLATNERIVLMKDAVTPPTVDDLVRLVGEDYDLVLVEGFKSESAPKIEVQRSATGPLLTGLKNLIAVISDDEIVSTVDRFPYSDVTGLANLLENSFIRPNAEHFSLYADGKPVRLTTFPKEFVDNLLEAIASSFGGAEKAKSLELRLKRG